MLLVPAAHEHEVLMVGGREEVASPPVRYEGAENDATPSP
jgi:hypothetical protein